MSWFDLLTADQRAAVFLMIAAVLVAAVIALAAAAAPRGFFRPKEAEARETDKAGILSAVTVLEERYAKGEIGREEFLEKMRSLEVSYFRDETSQRDQESSNG